MTLPEWPIEAEYNTPRYHILDRLRPVAAVRSGRHPGSTRELAAYDRHGRNIVTAFQYADYWHIDVETAGIKAVGIKPLSTEVLSGFSVRTEEQAVDWIDFLARAVTR